MIEKLRCVAIKRDDQILERGFKSHYQLRQAIDPNDPDPRHPQPGDIDGFMTSFGRFVDRDEARLVALEAGQISHHWKQAGRALLSSDINW